MKILMVCLGNICRSPLAHGILEHLVKENGLDWEIDSAGTGNWHVGEAPDQRSVNVAKNYDIDISTQVCRQFDQQDFDYYDLIYVMDHSNLKDVLALAKTEEHRKKVKLLLGDTVVPDPYYNDKHFDPVYRMIEKRCREILVEELKS